MSNNQAGFTLVELMIALTLGLIIVAAGLAIFLSGNRILALQNAMDELQQNANLGLALIAADLRLSNLNTLSLQQVNNKNNGSGIIFNAQNLPPSIRDNTEALWTSQERTEAATELKSDQLLIQYKPVYSKGYKGEGSNRREIYKGGYNCEGEKIEFNIENQGDNQPFGQKTLVNRYYIKKDPQQVLGEPEAYSLFCQSGYYADGDTAINGLKASGGQQIIKRVDSFKIRLGVKAPNGQLRYLSINQYLALMPESLTASEDFYNVVSIELNLLVRASTPLSKISLPNPNENIELAGTSLHLKDNQNTEKQYLRQRISQVIALRNTLGTDTYE